MRRGRPCHLCRPWDESGSGEADRLNRRPRRRAGKSIAAQRFGQVVDWRLLTDPRSSPPPST